MHLLNILDTMNFRPYFQIIALSLLLFSILQTFVFRIGRRHWVKVYSKPLQCEKLSSCLSPKTPPLISSLGQGALGTFEDLVQSFFQKQVKVIGCCDRIDLTPYVLIECMDHTHPIPLKTKTPLIDLKLNLDPLLASELEFEIEKKKEEFWVHLFKQSEKTDSFLLLNTHFEEDKDVSLDLTLKEMHMQWFGQDLFLKTFDKQDDKERLHFCFSKKEASTCLLKEKESLVFEENSWKPSRETSNKPMLYLKAVHPNELTWVYWSANGLKKRVFTLPKSQSSSHERYPKMIFLGIKTPGVWKVECEGQRQTLKTNDLWLYENCKWQKISTQNQLESYLAFERKGDLFIAQKLVQNKGKREVIGTWFNTQRCQKKKVRFSLTQETSKKSSP